MKDENSAVENNCIIEALSKEFSFIFFVQTKDVKSLRGMSRGGICSKNFHTKTENLVEMHFIRFNFFSCVPKIHSTLITGNTQIYSFESKML